MVTLRREDADSLIAKAQAISTNDATLEIEGVDAEQRAARNLNEQFLSPNFSIKRGGVDFEVAFAVQPTNLQYFYTEGYKDHPLYGFAPDESGELQKVRISESELLSNAFYSDYFSKGEVTLGSLKTNITAIRYENGLLLVKGSFNALQPTSEEAIIDAAYSLIASDMSRTRGLASASEEISQQTARVAERLEREDDVAPERDVARTALTEATTAEIEALEAKIAEAGATLEAELICVDSTYDDVASSQTKAIPNGTAVAAQCDR